MLCKFEIADIKSRLPRIEEEIESEKEQRWQEFSSQFSDEEIAIIAEGKADEELVYLFLECERLLMPREVKKVYKETLQEMEENSEQY